MSGTLLEKWLMIKPIELINYLHFNTDYLTSCLNTASMEVRLLKESCEIWGNLLMHYHAKLSRQCGKHQATAGSQLP